MDRLSRSYKWIKFEQLEDPQMPRNNRIIRTDVPLMVYLESPAGMKSKREVDEEEDDTNSRNFKSFHSHAL